MKRNEIYRDKKKLKKTGIYINEDLSQDQYSLFKNACHGHSKGNVWTANGKILAKTDEGIKVVKN